jgi:hypothetical protein
MNRPPLEVADIVHQYGAAFLARYGATLSSEQHRALRLLSRGPWAPWQRTAIVPLPLLAPAGPAREHTLKSTHMHTCNSTLRPGSHPTCTTMDHAPTVWVKSQEKMCFIFPIRSAVLFRCPAERVRQLL